MFLQNLTQIMRFPDFISQILTNEIDEFAQGLKSKILEMTKNFPADNNPNNLDNAWQYYNKFLSSADSTVSYSAFYVLEKYLWWTKLEDYKSQKSNSSFKSHIYLIFVDAFLKTSDEKVKDQILKVMLSVVLLKSEVLGNVDLFKLTLDVLQQNYTLPLFAYEEYYKALKYKFSNDSECYACGQRNTKITTCIFCKRNVCVNKCLKNLDFRGNNWKLCENCERKQITKFSLRDDYDEQIYFSQLIMEKVELHELKEGISKNRKKFENFYGNPKFADIQIVAKDFRRPAHKIILAAESEVFSRMLTDADVMELNFENVEAEVLGDILDFIYKETVDKFDEKAKKLLVAAENFGLEKLKTQCEESLIKQIKVTDTIETIVLAKKCNASNLINRVAHFIQKYKNEVMTLPNWKHFCSDHPDLVSQIFVNLLKHSPNPCLTPNIAPPTIQKTPINTNVEVSKDYNELFENKNFCDFTIKVDGKEIKAHKLVLHARSSYFATMFSHGFTESTKNEVEIKDYSYDCVKEMVRFIYCGEVQNLDKHVYDLLVVADQYNLQGLKVFCENHLITNFNNKNALKTLIAADFGNSGKLKKYTLDYIKLNAKPMIENPDWSEFAEKYPKLISDLMTIWTGL